jgi:hypothetical protein
MRILKAVKNSCAWVFMKKFQKLFHEVSKTAIVLTALTVSFATMTCREDLYEVAKNANDSVDNTRLIAALVNDGGNTHIILSDGQNMLKNFQAYAGTPSGTIYLDPRGWVFATEGMTIHAYHYDGRYEKYDGFASTPVGFAEDNGTTVTMVEKIVYGFDDKSNPPWSEKYNYSGMDSIDSIFNASDGTGAYMVDIYNKNFYHVSNGFWAGNIPTMPSGAFFFDTFEGMFYAGSAYQIRNSSGNWNTVQNRFDSFIIFSPTEVYAGGQYWDGSANHTAIMKADFDGSDIDSIFYFSSVDGQVRLAVYDSSTLVVGISNSDTNGLYLFKTTDSTLTQLSSLPVYAVSTLKKN